MRTALNSSNFEYTWPLTAPTPVALTMLATGTILVPAVNATFPILAAIACARWRGGLDRGDCRCEANACGEPAREKV